MNRYTEATLQEPLGIHKKQDVQNLFVKKYLKKPSNFWRKVSWTDNANIKLYQSDGKKKMWRQKGITQDPKHTSSSVKRGGGVMGYTSTGTYLHC